MALEIVIETWRGLDGTVDYRWSVWSEGRRLQMGGAFPDPQLCEENAQAYCEGALGRRADRVTRL